MRRLVTVMVVVVLGTVLGPSRDADACCLGCPCTKYKRAPRIMTRVAEGYRHSARGAVPAWNRARITKLLTSGTWLPLPARALTPSPPNVQIAEPPAIQFVTADRLDGTQVAQAVIVRRIEKHGRAFLVEVDDRVFRLAPCPQKRGFACLLDPGELALDPLPPPTAEEGAFAKPPP